jgi:hypothetical protein
MRKVRRVKETASTNRIVQAAEVALAPRLALQHDEQQARPSVVDAPDAVEGMLFVPVRPAFRGAA